MITTARCEYCGSLIRSDERVCPHCGAENPHYLSGETASAARPEETYVPGAVPGTIAQLKAWCADRGMPLEKMRFFIGENCREPRAFGIYRDGGSVVVYKNKSDGSRAVRYRGPDEALAVRELYGKLLEECHSRGIYPEDPSYSPVRSREIPSSPQRSYGGRQKSSRRGSSGVLIWIFALVLLFMLFGALSRGGSSGSSNYYSYSPGYSYSSGYDSYGSGSSSWGSSWSSSDSDDSWSSSSDWDSWDSWDTDWDSDW